MGNLLNCGTFAQLGSKAIKKALHDFADFDEDTRNEILKKKKNKFHQLKDKYKDVDNQVLEQSALVISIKEYINSIPVEKLQMQKHKKMFRKKDNKEKLLLQRWAIVREAILVSHLSFRELAEFLNKKYDLKINHSYLFQIWKKIEGDL